MSLPARLRKWQHVEIEWEDVRTDYGAFKSADIVKDPIEPCIRKSVGYVLFYSKTEGYIVIAAADDRDTGSENDCEDVTYIPLVYVNNIIKK